jgi:hypothetical protein
MTRRKLLALTAVVLVGIPLALYLFLFALQAYSVWQASRMLDRLEALRIGDPAQECDRALDGTAPENGTHTIAAGTYRFVRLTEWAVKVEARLADKAIALADRVGLRSWKLRANCGIKDGHVTGVTAGLMVDGREEILGAGWRLVSAIPDSLLRHEPDKSVATSIHFAAIDGPPNGEDVEIFATMRSSPADLSARRIDTRCLLSFRGCESLCQLLPHATRILEARDLASFACQPSHWRYEK